MLRVRRLTVSCAESLTGGELAALLSGAPGSSEVFLGGVVAYATEVKRQVLGVTAEQVVSAACAEQLAAGVRDVLGSDWSLATTGVAGPGEQEGRPVGTVFVGVAGPAGVSAHALHLEGDREQVRAQTCRAAVRLLAEALREAGEER